MGCLLLSTCNATAAPAAFLSGEAFSPWPRWDFLTTSHTHLSNLNFGWRIRWFSLRPVAATGQDLLRLPASPT
eukprot:CAMPEP_0172851534 /NCGR_PEP_ID=MMETSP1075-20121228/51701_1 /TAXON_ID=2916 /ORGANISM="Ceratium fusus, Strain PA161109" /LENGTH=72 /DNA_ID=CAMNT_0013697579 /DNA_START=151 /DNA_END=365 /DNA_ORIENTATION=+